MKVGLDQLESRYLWIILFVTGVLIGFQIKNNINTNKQLQTTQYKLDSVSLELNLFSDSVKYTVKQIDSLFTIKEIRTRDLNNVSLIHRRILQKLDSTLTKNEYNYVQKKIKEAEQAGLPTVVIPD